MRSTWSRLPVHLAAMIVVNAPLAALMFSPQLIRSRVEAWPGVAAWGVTALVVLPFVTLWLAPVVSARVDRSTGIEPARALRVVSALARRHRVAWWTRFGEWLGLLVVAQLVGGWIAWLVPYIWRNPRAAVDPDAPTWVLSYENFALQALSIYLVICFAHAWYAVRVTALAARTRTAC